MRNRKNLSDELADHIREMLFDGRLAPDSRINEVHLAKSLGVSRTPLREALRSLFAEDALTVVPRQGFFVRPLTLDEVRQIYPMRALLDPEALRLAGIPEEKTLNRLNQLTDRLVESKTVRRAIHYDEEWHRLLWRNCSNSVLKHLINQFMLRTRRYELASMSNPEAIGKSASSKQRIVSLLRDADLSAACLVLRESLTRGGEPVFQWLKRNGDKQ